MTNEVKIKLSVEGGRVVSQEIDGVKTSLEHMGPAADAAVNKSAAALNRVGISAKQTAAALRGVPAQFTDIVTSLQGGQAPLTVFLQQGGQLKDIFGGAGNAARALGGYVAGLTNPFSVAAGSVVALAVAYEQGAAESRALEKSLILSGNQAGVTTGQLMAMAGSIDKVVGTQGNAAEALGTMASAARVGGENLQQFTTTAIQFERVTGTAVEETAKKFAELRKAPLEATLKLNESMGYLTQATYDQIKALTEEGKAVEAATLAQAAFDKATASMAADIQANLGLVERSWNKVTGAVKEAWDEIKGIGRDAGLEGQVAAAQKMVDIRRQAASSIYATNSDQVKLSDAENQLKGYQELLKNQQLSAKYAAERTEQVKQLAEWDRLGAKYLGDSVKMEREIATAKELGSRAGKTAMEIAQRELEIKKSYEKLNRKSEAEREAERKAAQEQNERMRIGRQLAMQMGDEVTKANTAYQKELAETAKAQAKAQAEANKESAKYYDGLAKDLAAQESANQKLREQNEEIGLTSEALGTLRLARLDATIALEQETLAMAYAHEASVGEVLIMEQRIKLLKEQRSLTGSSQTAEANAKTTKEAIDADSKRAEKLGDSVTDALYRGFENGKGFAENFADTVKNTFNTMVLRPVIQGVVGAGLSAVGMNAAASSVTGGVGSAVGGMFSAGSMAALGSAFGSSVSAGFGATMAGATSLAIEGGMASMAAGTSTAIASGLGQIAGALGPYALAAVAIYGLLGGFKGSYVKSTGDAAVNFGATGNVTSASDFAGANYEANISTAATDFVANLNAEYLKAAKALNLGAVASAFAFGSNDSDGGKFRIGAAAGGFAFDSGELAQSPEALQLAASRAIFAAVQGSELPGYLSKAFNGLTANTASQEQISAAYGFAESLKTVRFSLLSAADQVTELQTVVDGGFATLGTSAATFKTDFIKAIDAGLTPESLSQWQALGGTMQALEQITPKATEALKELGRSAADIATERTRLQDQLDELTMTSTQLLDKQRNALDASNRGLFDQVQTATAAKTASEALAQAQLDQAASAKAATEAATAAAISSQQSLASKYAAPLNVASASALLPTGIAEALLTQGPAQIRDTIANYIKSLDPLTDTGRAAIAQVQGLSGALDVLVGSVDSTAAATAAAAEAAEKAQVMYAQEMQKTADAAIGAANRAFDTVVSTVNALKNAASELYKSQEDALRKTVGTVSTSLSSLVSLSSRIASIVNTAAADQPQARTIAQAELGRLLALGKTGVSLTTGKASEDLDKALQTIAYASDSNRYANATAFALDNARTQTTLGQIKALTDNQITDQQLMQKTLEGQLKTLEASYKTELESLDSTVKAATLQINAMNGVTTSVIGLSTAMGALASAINAAEGAKAAALIAQTNTTAGSVVATTNTAATGLGAVNSPLYVDRAQVRNGVSYDGTTAWRIGDLSYNGVGNAYLSYSPTGTYPGVYTSAQLESINHWPTGVINTWADTKGLPHFAQGGAFASGIVSRPTSFDMGLMGEAGPEAIMPLANINGSLGVRFAGNSSNEVLVAEIRALRAEVARLRADNSAENRAIVYRTGNTAKLLDRVINGEDSINTVAA